MHGLQRLTAAFDHTTNSYKYYWWLAILDLIKENRQTQLPFSDIVISIFSKIWYPVNYYKISLGKSDRLSKFCLELGKHYAIREDISESDLINFLMAHKGDSYFQNMTREITRYVPYRFLRPWFVNELRGVADSKVNRFILDHQLSKESELPYTIGDGMLTISVTTLDWILTNYELISSFTYYKLLHYVEKNNRRTPSLLVKLFKPQARNLSLATKMWKSYLNKNGGISCVFDTNETVFLDDFSVDHFMPWSFCTHDYLWNLHPISKSINSSKSNNLPDITYLDDYIRRQYDFSRFLVSEHQNKPLEDYNSLFKTNTDYFKTWTDRHFSSSLQDIYLPMFEIAENMGFNKGWKL